MREITISGKNYFGVQEAAVYLNVSVSQFNKKIASDDDWKKLPRLNIMGKIAFRKVDIDRTIEQTNSFVKLPKRLSGAARIRH